MNISIILYIRMTYKQSSTDYPKINRSRSLSQFFLSLVRVPSLFAGKSSFYVLERIVIWERGRVGNGGVANVRELSCVQWTRWILHRELCRGNCGANLWTRWILQRELRNLEVMAAGEIIQFDPFVSRIEAGFWHELAQRKLEEYKLSEAKQAIRGCYSNGMLMKWLCM